MKREHQVPTANDHLPELRFQRDVEHLYRLGRRAVFEFLSEIGRARMCRTYIEELTARYAQLDPAIVRAVGANRFAALPIHGVA